jgi:hypothetical protein
MVQDQLVEYINTQLKAGVTADAVRAALVGAGWQAADVDDTMKRVQSGAGGGAASQPKAAVAAQGAGPAVIRVSDLVSSSSGPGMTSGKTDAVVSKIAAGGSSPKPLGSTIASTSSSSSPSPSGGVTVLTPAKVKKSHALATESVLGILMILFGAAAIFLFFENRGLSSQIGSLNASSATLSSEIASLQSQLNSSTSALTAQVGTASAASAELALELSFYAVPPTEPATTTFTSALKGTVVGGGKSPYVIVGVDGAKITVANSKDPHAVALLQPLSGGTTSTHTFSGDYVPGVPSITLIAVDGVSVAPPATVPTSTTSTTTSNASGTAVTTGQ